VLGIVASRADDASMAIRDQLLSLADWDAHADDRHVRETDGCTVHRLPDAELRTFDRSHLELEAVADHFADPSVLAVASRHRGDTGPLLTAHHTGNFGAAEYGGRDGTLARAAPNAHRTVVAALHTHAPEGYAVGMECTHHGPSDVGAPSLFVEVGSGPEQWADAAATGAVARAIMSLRGVAPDRPQENDAARHLVGFGGGHYAPRFERVLRETDWAVGHVAADWALATMDPDAATDVIEQAFEKSAAEHALLAGDQPDLAAAIEDLEYRVVSETWVRETAGVPLGLVGDLEAAIGTVDAGLRFGAPAEDRSDSDAEVPESPARDVLVAMLPTELHETASGIDRDDTLAAVDAMAVAYDTEQGGSLLEGTVALEKRADGDALVERLRAVLGRKYDRVERDGDDLLATRERFVPELARAAGVSPGPAFGRLAGGESVTVDDTTVHPDDVTETVERRVPAALCWRD
jgi:D-aminoacyl-tRNA deacylase